RALGLEAEPGCELDMGGKHLARDGLNRLGVMGAVGLLGGDGDDLAVADRHAGDRLVETGDDLAGAEAEFERVAVARGVEGGAIGEAAGVMDAHSVAGARLGHGFSAACCWGAAPRRAAAPVSDRPAGRRAVRAVPDELGCWQRM